MAILKADKITNLGDPSRAGSITVNEYLLTKHNPNKINMPSGSMEGKVIGVTVHNTDWIVVDSRSNCGNTPVGLCVTGWVNKSDI